MWQAFVGIDHNLNAIIVAIRGTQENRFYNNCQILLAILSFPLSCKHIMSLSLTSLFFSEQHTELD
jgi:hypothetical protein